VGHINSWLTGFQLTGVAVILWLFDAIPEGGTKPLQDRMTK